MVTFREISQFQNSKWTVRVSKYKNIFDKGYETNFTEEIFKIARVFRGDPNMYELVDVGDEPIIGKFYEEELSAINKTDDVYRVEKILRRRKGQALVTWAGYDSKHNSWIPIPKDQQDKEAQRDGARQILEIITREKKFGDYGEKSRELLDNLSEAKFNEKGKLTALKFKGKDVKLTVKGLVNKTATVQNREIRKAIESAKAEYEESADAEVDKRVGFSVSDEARESVRENVIERTESSMKEMNDIIEEKDSDGNTKREIRGIRRTDENMDYDNMKDPNQKLLYDGKIKALRAEAKRYNDLEKKEKDPTKKLLYGTARDLCIIKEINMEMKANERPKSDQGRTMVGEEADANDLTRFERFKRWVKKNITGVSAVAISVAGVVTAAVMAGRNVLKKAAKPVGQFGKALANLAKKAGPAIATILNILARVLTWGVKALEFLSRNLWMVALFLTYLLYDMVKERFKRR